MQALAAGRLGETPEAYQLQPLSKLQGGVTHIGPRLGKTEQGHDSNDHYTESNEIDDRIHWGISRRSDLT